MPIKSVGIRNYLASERTGFLMQKTFSWERRFLTTVTLLRWKIFILRSTDNPRHTLQFAKPTKFRLNLIPRSINNRLCNEIARGRMIILFRWRILGCLSVVNDVVGLKRVGVMWTEWCIGVEHALMVGKHLPGLLVVVCWHYFIIVILFILSKFILNWNLPIIVVPATYL